MQNTDNVVRWEKAFERLNKRYFSADLFGGYDIIALLAKYASLDSKILDFGCGTGATLAQLKQKGYRYVIGADPSSALLSESATNVSSQIFQISEGKLPLANDSQDLVFVSGVLHHIAWDDLPSALFEIKRVLRPGGILLILEPRRSVFRTLGHWVVLSPLAKIWRNLGALADCLRAEWPTYVVWLAKEKEFWPKVHSQGFSPLLFRRKLMTLIAVFRLEP